MCDYGQVVVKFLFELDEIADIIDTLVESSCELRGNRLQANFFVCQCGQDNQQFDGRLRGVRFIHRNFGDDIAFALGGNDMAIDLACVLNGEKILGGHSFNIAASCRERSTDARQTDCPDQFWMPIDKCLDVARCGWFTDRVGHIDREKV